MKIIKLQCPNCGAVIKADADKEKALCAYCGTEMAVPNSRAKVTVREHKFNKRAFYIFGAVALVIIIAAVAVVLTVTHKKKIPPNAYKTAGVYLVGEDIPAGEYILYPYFDKSDGDVTPVMEVRLTRDTAENASDFLYRREIYFRQYVDLNEGEYIAFEYAVMYLPEKAKLKELGSEGYAAAQLKVGTDIPEGEYVIVGRNRQVQYYITDIPEAQIQGGAAINSPHMLSFDYCENRLYTRVKSGEYISYSGGRLYKPEDAPKPEKAENGEYLPGQYRVGTDIEPGEYTVTPSEGNETLATVCINKDCVNTSYIRDWETDILQTGAETLLFLRHEDITADPCVSVPRGGETHVYITFSYCMARLQDRL